MSRPLCPVALILLTLALSSARAIEPTPARSRETPTTHDLPRTPTRHVEPAPARSRETPTVYDYYRTPPAILRGIAHTESDGLDWAVGDDGISRGRMQLNSRYDAQRVRAWGCFDPHAPLDAVRIASCIFQDNLVVFQAERMRAIRKLHGEAMRELLSVWDEAIAAYRQGIGGVHKNGATMWYVNRVKARGGAK